MSREKWISRRAFLRTAGAVYMTAGSAAKVFASSKLKKYSKPNVVFILTDQWRAQAAGYAGDPNLKGKTPHLDRLAEESINFTNAVSGCPVCCPYRATLMTGQLPLTHGVFLNDVQLKTNDTTLAIAYKRAGYDTAYIGKWHLNANGRSNFIPRENRLGFDYWKALECTHNYNNSYYYGDENIKLKWNGYDAIAQTQDAHKYIESHGREKPFMLVLSWGPPHAPYGTAPKKYRDMFDPRDISLRPNVPEKDEKDARKYLVGYYAHIAALDDCVGRIVETLDKSGLAENTILVFTSDHGDMLKSHGRMKKQQPWDESIRVPMLVRYPKAMGKNGRKIDTLFNSPDIMPTLLGLSSIEIPKSVEGMDFSPAMLGTGKVEREAALITCPAPFGQWNRVQHGGKEYRGLRTRRYTYARDLEGPWLLYDNEKDPYQLNNLCGNDEYADLLKRLDKLLSDKLKSTNDQFQPAEYYIKKWSYTVDETGTVPYTN